MVKHLVGIRSPTRHPRRRLHSRISASVKEYAQQAGLISWASNNVQMNLQAMFCTLMLPHKFETTNAMWHAIKSDDGQRSLLLAVTKGAYQPRSKFLASVIWAVDAAGKLAALRNDAIHTATTMQANRDRGWYVVPSEDWGQPARVERLNRLGHKKAFKLVFGDLNQLSEYTHFLSVKAGADPSVTLPRRPRLQAIPLLSKSPPKTSSRQQRTQGRKRLRPALRG